MSELDVAVEVSAAKPAPAALAAGLNVRIASELVERARAEGVSLGGQGGLLQQVTRAVLQAALELDDLPGRTTQPRRAGREDRRL